MGISSTNDSNIPNNTPYLKASIAKHYAADLNFHILACCVPGANGQCGCGGWYNKKTNKYEPHTGKQVGKAPLITDWQPGPGSKSTTTAQGIDALNKERPDCNFGGWYPQQLIIDVDPEHGGFESLTKLQAKYGPLNETLTHQTGGGGLHICYKQPPGYNIGNTVNMAGYPGIDRRGNGGQILLPGSQHRNGNTYTVFKDCPIVEAPEWLLKIDDTPEAKDAKEKLSDAFEKIPIGQNDDWLAHQAGIYAKCGDTEDRIAAKQELDAQRLEQDPNDLYIEKDFRRIAHSIYTKHQRESANEQDKDVKTYHFTDLGNAERLIDRHGINLRYCYSRKMWLYWNGKFWEWVEDGRITALAAETIRNLYRMAANIEDKDLRGALIDHARRSESESKLSAMVILAQTLHGVSIPVDQLDVNDYLLNFNNGTVDLRTGELKFHNRNDYITAFIPRDYDPSVKTELWDAFLNTIFEGHNQLGLFVRRGLGYSCTGSQNEQVAFFPYSLGGSGKSTLIGSVCDALGSDYATEIEPQVFMVKPHEQAGPNEGVAKLYRKRLAISTEIEDGQRLSISLIKRMTGGEKLHHEKKFEHGFEFTPTHKLWMSGNHKPVITDTTLSIWRRVKLINFPVTIPEDKRDRTLRDKLKSPENQKAILAWLVAGAVEWFNNGMGEPPEVVEATKAYKEDQDIVGNFLDECCEIDPLQAVLQADLYKTYSQWCIEVGNSILPKGKLRERVLEKGNIIASRAHGNAASWKGVKLNEYGVNLVNAVNEKYQKSHRDGFTKEFTQKRLTDVNQINQPLPENGESGTTSPEDLPEGANF